MPRHFDPHPWRLELIDKLNHAIDLTGETPMSEFVTRNLGIDRGIACRLRKREVKKFSLEVLVHYFDMLGYKIKIEIVPK